MAFEIRFIADKMSRSGTSQKCSVLQDETYNTTFLYSLKKQLIVLRNHPLRLIKNL